MPLKQLRMRHPEIAGEALVPSEQVFHEIHEENGWELVEEVDELALAHEALAKQQAEAEAAEAAAAAEAEAAAPDPAAAEADDSTPKPTRQRGGRKQTTDPGDKQE